MIRAVLLIALLTQAMAAQQLSFVACPIVRDTKTVPCWLAEYEGELYYLGVQEDQEASTSLPQQSHEVLVEGTVQPGPRVCGGIPLSALSLSVMPELTRSCNTVLPAKDQIEAPAGNLRDAGTTQAVEAAPSTPDQPREFTVAFDFDSDRMSVRGTETVARAVAWASSTHASSLRITAWRGAALLSDGRAIAENEFVAGRRASKISSILKGLGIVATTLDIRVENAPVKPDGVTDPANRRVVISVQP